MYLAERLNTIACRLLLPAFLLLACPDAGVAGGMVIVGAGGSYRVPVMDYKESRFQKVIRQQYDFSCGSAAVATLLTHHYGQNISEQDVFEAMYRLGDKASIRKNGFSLLDMKKFLEARGYLADGYELPVDVFADLGIPAITLITKDRYRHFVVVKGINENEVLIGDSAAGIRVMARAELEAAYNGIFFLIRNEAEAGRLNFNKREDWLAWRRAPAAEAVGRAALSTFTLSLPRPGDF